MFDFGKALPGTQIALFSHFNLTATNILKGRNLSWQVDSIASRKDLDVYLSDTFDIFWWFKIF